MGVVLACVDCAGGETTFFASREFFSFPVEGAGFRVGFLCGAKIGLRAGFVLRTVSELDVAIRVAVDVDEVFWTGNGIGVEVAGG